MGAKLLPLIEKSTRRFTDRPLHSCSERWSELSQFGEGGVTESELDDEADQAALNSLVRGLVIDAKAYQLKRAVATISSTL